MSCVRGCCASQAAHYREVLLSGPRSEHVSTGDADMAAYARLRRNGLQPPGIAGAAALERGAHVPQEIVQGTLIRNARLRREVQADIDSMPPPAVTPTTQGA